MIVTALNGATSTFNGATSTFDGAVSTLNGTIIALNGAVVTLNSTIAAFYGSVAALEGTIVALNAAATTLDSVVISGASDTGGAVTVAAEVTTIPAVVHAEVLSVRGTEVVAVPVVVASSAYSVPGMGTTIGIVEVRTAEIEVVTIRIAGVDTEVPVTSFPVKRTIEIGSSDKSIPLPVEEYIAQVQVAALPVGSEHISTARDSHQVVEVDFVACLILLICQIQLVGHLVGQEQCLVTGLLIAHGIC